MLEYSTAQTPEEKQAAFALRKRVFVGEQKVPENLEKDEHDLNAVHIIAEKENTVVGTARLVIEADKGHVGRVAVDQNMRGAGIGKGVMLELEKKAKELNLKELYLHAQTHAMRFYEILGYMPRGEIFEEAGIEHIEMCKKL